MSKITQLVFLLTFICLSQIGFSQSSIQLSGLVTDEATKEPLIGATIMVGKQGAVTDYNGYYLFEVTSELRTLTCSFIGYTPQEVPFESVDAMTLDIVLTESPNLLQGATVTSGRFEKALGEVTVSLEVIKPALLQSINANNVTNVLDKVPGVQIIDGQANIRGGSGFSYGAGSRVLLLVDDIPILTADAGFPNWSDVPVENVEQIEVVKGAASALYGSSALNGIINIRTGFAKATPETKIFSFATVYDSPRESTNGADRQWWTNENWPRRLGGGVLHKQKLGKVDLVVGGYFVDHNSYNKDNFQTYGRINGGVRYRLTDQLSIGFNTNINTGKTGDFFYWLDSEAGAYQGTASTINTSQRTRFNIDPYLNYFDKKGNRHKVLTRYYSVNNNNTNNQSNQSDMFYSEYQFQRKWAELGLGMTAGAVYTGTLVSAELYGDTLYQSHNAAAYMQLDKQWRAWNFSGGVRLENNVQLSPEEIFGVSIPNGRQVERKPVFRLGANYKASEYTFIRASWGQGYRYPTIAERFITTVVGGLAISPNPLLQSETGYSTEIGVKQGFKISEWQGFVDFAGFYSAYQDMMEFSFIDFVKGFQSINIGGTSIYGGEVSIAGRGEIGPVKTSLLAGYTYIQPRFDQFDEAPIIAGVPPTQGQLNVRNSSANENILKYRFRHSVKFDIEGQYKAFSLAFSTNYNSNMVAMDEIFERFVVPGLPAFRQEYNKGYVVSGIRMGAQVSSVIKLSGLIDNLFNTVYSVRPGILDAPRAYTLRMDIDF